MVENRFETQSDFPVTKAVLLAAEFFTLTGELGDVLGDEDVEKIVHKSTEVIQQLLKCHPETAIFDSREFQLIEQAFTSRFTVAIMGIIKRGKSTLLNALIGKDLSPTGITSTTATINRFRHGSGEQCEQFCVKWKKDRPDTYMPLGSVKEWIKKSQPAKETKCLDFFVDDSKGSDFPSLLKDADIIDTPGILNMDEAHAAQTEEYLDRALQDLELHALIYVVTPSPRLGDQERFKEFQEKTNIPGTHAYNTIAVVQKWEGQDWWEKVPPDPLSVVEKQCKNWRKHFGDEVSEVLPVSGMLANAYQKITDGEVWRKLAILGSKSTTDAVEKMCLRPVFLRPEINGASLGLPERKWLAESMQKSMKEPVLGSSDQPIWWHVLAFSIRYAHYQKIDDGQKLRERILEVSGIEKLRTVLKNRFFSLASLIRCSNALRKANGLWSNASRTLKNIQSDREERARQIQEILHQYNTDPGAGLEPVREYIDNVIKSSSGIEIKVAKVLEDILTNTFGKVRRIFGDLDDDIECLSNLAKLTEEIPAEDREILRYLFGQYGRDPWTRIQLSPESESEAVDKRLSCLGAYINKKYKESRVPAEKTVWQHAQKRFRQIDNLPQIKEIIGGKFE
jgi:hypothetical protein